MFAAGSLVSALGQSIGVLILGRAIQGAGGAIFPLAFGIIRDEFPPERVATSIGLISATFGIGGGLGLVLAGVIVDHLSVQLDLLVVGDRDDDRRLGHLALRARVARARAREHRLGRRGTALARADIALLLGVSQGNAWGWGSAGVLGLFAAALVLATVFVAFERRVDEPMVDMRLMSQRPVWSTNLTAFAIGFAMFGSYVLIPQLVELPSVTGYGFASPRRSPG